jgi:hypothetical protein
MLLSCDRNCLLSFVFLGSWGAEGTEQQNDVINFQAYPAVVVQMMAVFWGLHHVECFVFSDVSDEHTTTIFGVTELVKVGNWLIHREDGGITFPRNVGTKGSYCTV